MKNENGKRPPKKEQLYSEPFFTDFCEWDRTRGRKIEKQITKAFLDACEKDDLVVPLLVERGMVPTPDGTQVEGDVRYYSPFQIYFVSALAENQINPDGYLHDPSTNISVSGQPSGRYILWGGWTAFSAEIYLRKKKEGAPDDAAGPNYYRLADDFHQLLRLLHSFDEEKDPRKRDPQRARSFQREPVYQYQLDELRQGGAEMLAAYGLDIGKLKKLAWHIGYYASHVDPLERWYHYLRRHPQWRRDMLKGKASLAQDLYGLFDTIAEIIEIVSGEKLPPLLEYIHPDIQPYLFERAGYAEGADIKAVQAAYRQLRDWVELNKDVLAEVEPLSVDGKLLGGELDKLGKLEAALSDYEKRYGDRRYTSGMRFTEPEEKLDVGDLDDGTQRWVEMVMAQHKSARRTEDGKTHFVTSFDEIAEMFTKRKITFAQAEQMDRELELKYEITRAIEHRLDDLARDIMGIASQAANVFWALIEKTEQEKRMSVPKAMEEFNKGLDRIASDFSVKQAQFWRTFLPKYQKPYDDKISTLRRKQAELHGIASQARLVFCAVCRENPVRLHHSYNDGRVTNEAVCDKCFKNASAQTLQASNEDWKKIKYAEWKCDGCRQRTLYKFALGNTVSMETRGVPIQIILEYGRMELKAKCPKCGILNNRTVDWGWHP